jgi:hypothetical protein
MDWALLLATLATICTRPIRNFPTTWLTFETFSALQSRDNPDIRDMLNTFIGDKTTLQLHLHRWAAKLLDDGKVTQA